MAVILESQIKLKLLTNNISFSSSKRITEVHIQQKWIEIEKVIYIKRNYYNIEITEDSIDHKQFVNNSIKKIEI